MTPTPSPTQTFTHEWINPYRIVYWPVFYHSLFTMSAWDLLIIYISDHVDHFKLIKKNVPVKGAQVPKVGRCQQRLGQKPKFVVFFFGSLP